MHGFIFPTIRFSQAFAILCLPKEFFSILLSSQNVSFYMLFFLDYITLRIHKVSSLNVQEGILRYWSHEVKISWFGNQENCHKEQLWRSLLVSQNQRHKIVQGCSLLGDSWKTRVISYPVIEKDKNNVFHNNCCAFEVSWRWPHNGVIWDFPKFLNTSKYWTYQMGWTCMVQVPILCKLDKLTSKAKSNFAKPKFINHLGSIQEDTQVIFLMRPDWILWL